MTASSLPRHLLVALVVACTPQAWAQDHAHAHAQDPALRASTPPAPDIASPVTVPLDPATLAALPRQPVTARVHETTLQCEGVALVDLLRATGAIPDGRLGSPHLARYVLADARDGYRVLFSLAELDPATGNRPVFVVDRCDGSALAADDGPLRLLAPGDVRAARSVRQLESLNVVVAP